MDILIVLEKDLEYMYLTVLSSMQLVSKNIHIYCSHQQYKLYNQQLKCSQSASYIRHHKVTKIFFLKHHSCLKVIRGNEALYIIICTWDP